MFVNCMFRGFKSHRQKSLFQNECTQGADLNAELESLGMGWVKSTEPV